MARKDMLRPETCGREIEFGEVLKSYSLTHATSINCPDGGSNGSLFTQWKTETTLNKSAGRLESIWLSDARRPVFATHVIPDVTERQLCFDGGGNAARGKYGEFAVDVNAVMVRQKLDHSVVQ